MCEFRRSGRLSRDIVDTLGRRVRMDLADYVINAVLVEGRSVREVAGTHHLGKVPGTVCRRAKP